MFISACPDVLCANKGDFASNLKMVADFLPKVYAASSRHHKRLDYWRIQSYKKTTFSQISRNIDQSSRMFKIPSNGLAAVTKQFGPTIEFEQVAIKAPGPAEALVKITASGVCHTDLIVCGM